MGGTEPATALIPGSQGPWGAAVANPLGSSQFRHQMLAQFPSPERWPVRPVVGNSANGFEQRRVDASEGVGPGGRILVMLLVPVDRSN